jgi:hypothetical protein
MRARCQRAVASPGLKLTTDQAFRLWNLKEAQCINALEALIAEGFLMRTPAGVSVFNRKGPYVLKKLCALR